MADPTTIKHATAHGSVPPAWVVRGVMALRNVLQRAADALVPSEVVMMEHMGIFGKPFAMTLVTQMGIADALAERGPVTAQELASIVGADPHMLHRLLRYLCCFHVFKVDKQGRFSNTRLSSQLERNAVMRNVVLLFGGTLNVTLWSGLAATVRSGQNAFERLHGPLWQWFADHPEDGVLFVNGMASMTTMEAPAIAAGYPYGRFGVLCDVGGGSGILVGCILARNPNLRAILLDHETMLAYARRCLTDAGVGDRVELVSGDFFDAVPPGADVYMLKDIMHDWSDAQCGRILENIRRAAKKETVLLIHETIAEIDSLGPAAIMDLQMAVSNEGHNRSRIEFAELLHRCGFRVKQVISLPVPTSTIEAVAI